MTTCPYYFSNYPRFLAALLCLGLLGCGDDSSYSYNGNTSSGQVSYDNAPDSANNATESRNVSREYVDSTPVQMQEHNFNPPMRVSPGGKDLAQRRAAQVQNVISASKKYGIEPYMIHAIITVDSNYKPHAQSEVGAAGLMQLMPYTGERFGCGGSSRFQSACNINAGTAYLKFLSKRFGGNLQAVAAAYNAGEGTVDSYLHGKPLKEKIQRALNRPMVSL